MNVGKMVRKAVSFADTALRVFVPSMVCLALAARAESVRITVHEGETHTFWGIGASATLAEADDQADQYNALPQDFRNKMANFFWRDGGFRVLRMWTGSELTADDMYRRFGTFAKDALRANPTMTFVMGPWEPKQGMDQHANAVADQIKKFRDEGIPVEATGVSNEPNVHGPDPNNLPTLVIKFREALDARGLEDVKVIAPEVSNVDNNGISFIEKIIANKQALDALGAFSTHSYGMCLLKEVYDMVHPYGKEYWQTESSANGPESFDDDYKAGKFVSRVISDANLGVTHWCYFIAYTSFDPADNTTRVMGYDPATMEFKPFLKYYYFTQVAHTLRPGTAMRLCESNLGGGSRFQWMENTYGGQPPLCACAGVNPDGAWGLALVNKTATEPNGNIYVPAPAADYDVTFVVEELKGEGDIEFNVYLSNKTEHFVKTETKTMHNGEITFHAGPRELVTALNADATEPVVPTTARPHAVPARPASMRLHAFADQAGGVSVAFFTPESGSAAARHDVRLTAYGLNGRMVGVLVDSSMRPGKHEVRWHAPASGAYLLRLECGPRLRTATVALP